MRSNEIINTTLTAKITISLLILVAAVCFVSYLIVPSKTETYQTVKADAAGNTTIKTVNVTVPHNQRK